MRKLGHIKHGDWSALVKHVKTQTGLRTGALAKKAGVVNETWWRWEERGQKPKDLDAVEKFAEGFQDLLELDDALWAAGMVPESPEQKDPRLGDDLDPNDRTVRKIMALDVDEGMRDFLLHDLRQRRRRELERELEDIERQVEAWRRGREPAEEQTD